MKLSFEELLSDGGHFEGQFAFKEDEMVVEVESFSADFLPTDAGLYLDVSFSYAYTAACAKCLEATKGWDKGKVGIQLMKESTELLAEEKELSDDDMGICYIEGDEIDLDEIIRQEVVFNLPVRVVCSDDCKGLCQYCGANLNQGRCKCETNADPRWTALNKLKNN